MDADGAGVVPTIEHPSVGHLGRISAGRELYGFLRPFLEPVKSKVILALAIRKPAFI